MGEYEDRSTLFIFAVTNTHTEIAKSKMFSSVCVQSLRYTARKIDDFNASSEGRNEILDFPKMYHFRVF